MRKILFRGKRLDNGEWMEGAFCPKSCDDPFGPMLDKPSIIKLDEPCDGFWFDVDPATVGQCTGLKDRNGKWIFEGDIIKSHYANVPKADFIEEVVFHNGRFCALYQKDGCKMWQSLADGVPHHPMDRLAYMEWCEVIGNIHDNPELLEGVNE